LWRHNTAIVAKVLPEELSENCQRKTKGRRSGDPQVLIPLVVKG
jgi:hypothetical protein